MPITPLFFNVLGPAEALSLHMSSKDGVHFTNKIKLIGKGSATGYEVHLEYNSFDEDHLYNKTVVKQILCYADKLAQERKAGRSTVSLWHAPGDRVEQTLVYYGKLLVFHSAFMYSLEDGFVNAPTLLGTAKQERENIIGVPMEYEEEDIREGWTSRRFHNPEMLSYYQDLLDGMVADYLRETAGT